MVFIDSSKGCGLPFIELDSGLVLVLLMPSFLLGIVAGYSSLFFGILTSKKKKKSVLVDQLAYLEVLFTLVEVRHRLNHLLHVGKRRKVYSLKKCIYPN